MRLRSPQITPALIISLVALFVSLGGTAYAAIVVSSNSQVAQNTIAGHAPITGIHPNLISGSVNATDLSAAYKTSVKVHCPSGMYYAGGLCFEPNTRASASFISANSTCQLANRRLPTLPELAVAFNNLSASQSGEWFDDLFVSNGQTVAATLSQSTARQILVTFFDYNSLVPYRCVTTPTN